MNSIFEYLDYRIYIKDFYTFKKSESPFFSLRYICSKVGMDSGNLARIMNGALHLSNKKISEFIKLFRFNEKEAKYFETLVLFNKSKLNREQTLYFERLLNIKGIDAVELQKDQYEFFSNWYHSAIWGLLNNFKLKRNYAELVEQLIVPVTIAQAKESVKLLERLNLIEKDSDGVYRVTKRNLSTGREWHSLAIMKYQKTMIGLTLDSLDRLERIERDVSTVTFNMPRSALPEFRELIMEFRKTVMKSAEQYDHTREVFQLNVQLFPLTKENK